MNRAWNYLTGEPVLEGDVVTLGSLDAVVVAIISRDSPEFIDSVGEGIEVEGPAFGRLHTEFINEDLVLVHRKNK